MGNARPEDEAATSSAAVPNPITVKLMVDGRANRVIFAEAGRDMVDLLFGLLTMRISSAACLLGENGAGSDGTAKLGSLSRLYTTALSLSPKYIEEPPKIPSYLASYSSPVESPTTVLQQAKKVEASRESHALSAATKNRYLYYCWECRSVASLYPGHRCTECDGSFTDLILKEEDHYCCYKSTAKPYVRDLRYMVADDLGVTSSSGSSCLEMLRRLGVEMADLEEKIVEVGEQERVALFRASLVSSTALTDVFLGKKADAKIVQEEAAAAGGSPAKRKRKVDRRP